MNPSTPNFIALAAALIAAGSHFASAQTTATTDPVGFVTVNIAAGTGTTAQLSFKALGLTRPVEYQGSAETATAGTNQLVDAEATAGYGITISATSPYYLEITSGSAAGTTYDIASVSGTTINLVQNLANNVTAPVTFKVRKHWTVASVFGTANEAGLTGGNVSASDKISILRGGTYDSYYYQTVGFGTGWRKAGAPAVDASNDVIYPDDGLLFSRTASSGVGVVLTGAVKTGQTSTPVSTGLNIVSNPYAAPMTLASSGLYNVADPAHSIAGGNVSSADAVFIWNGTSYDAYYYQTVGFGTGWRKGGEPSTDVGATVQIPAGAAFVIKRNGAAFDWIAPQHPTNL